MSKVSIDALKDFTFDLLQMCKMHDGTQAGRTLICIDQEQYAKLLQLDELVTFNRDNADMIKNAYLQNQKKRRRS